MRARRALRSQRRRRLAIDVARWGLTRPRPPGHTGVQDFSDRPTRASQTGLRERFGWAYASVWTIFQPAVARGWARSPRVRAWGSLAVPAMTRPMMPWAMAARRNMAKTMYQSQSGMPERPTRRQ